MSAEDTSFLVCGVDPGLTQGALACVDLRTGEMIDATPYSLAELRSCALRDPHSRPAVPSTNELAECLYRCVRDEHCGYFDCARHVFIEQQMKAKLHAAQVGMELLVLDKRTQSSMTALRAYHGTRVSESTIKGPKRNRKRAAYAMRKELSINAAERDSVMPKKARELAWKISIDYWAARVDRYQLNTTSKYNAKVHKAYSDIVEAYMHATFPGNWRVFISPELLKCQGRDGFATVVRRLAPNKLQPTLRDAATAANLPLRVLKGISDYECWARNRRRTAARKTKERATSSHSRRAASSASDCNKRRRV